MGKIRVSNPTQSVDALFGDPQGGTKAMFLYAGQTSLSLGKDNQFFASVDRDERLYLSLTDKGGFETVIGSTELENPRTGETNRISAASVNLFGKNKKVLWS